MTVLLTGAAGGLGLAIAEKFAARGQSLALLDRTPGAAEEAATRLAGEYGVEAIALGADVTSRASIDDAWDAAEAHAGAIDVVVNNAGRFVPTDFRELSYESWQATLDVNLGGAFHTSQRAAQTWVPAGVKGAIVNVASIAAFTAGYGGAVDYGVSKAGLVGLTIHLAVDLGQFGIRSNAVAPGSFYSPMNAARLANPEQEAKSAGQSPLKRIGQPGEVADVVVFLGLDATYVNGTVVNVDGGVAVVM